MSPSEYLDTAALAARLGIGQRTVTEYLFRSRRMRADGQSSTAATWNFPEPDKHYGGRPVWLPSTIDRWQNEHPERLSPEPGDPA